MTPIELANKIRLLEQRHPGAYFIIHLHLVSLPLSNLIILAVVGKN